MAFKAYYSVGGRLLGEATGGVATRYMTDHLGSVVGTISTTTTVNRYTYSPYGRTIAKTGKAPDPRFLWNGGTGSRATNLPHAEQYNRRRHYSNTDSRWTTRDPRWPAQSAYGYVAGNPVTRIDPSGEILLEPILLIPTDVNPLPPWLSPPSPTRACPGISCTSFWNNFVSELCKSCGGGWSPQDSPCQQDCDNCAAAYYDSCVTSPPPGKPPKPPRSGQHPVHWVPFIPPRPSYPWDPPIIAPLYDGGDCPDSPPNPGASWDCQSNCEHQFLKDWWECLRWRGPQQSPGVGPPTFGIGLTFLECLKAAGDTEDGCKANCVYLYGYP